MNESFRRHPASWLTGLASVLFVGSVLAWWLWVYQSPRHVFDAMLVNNLTTSAVTKNELNGGDGQNVLQRVNVQLGGDNAARWFVTIQQSASSVTTDSIGTPQGGYVRYAQILDDKGKPETYSSALNIWAKGQPNDGTTLSKLFEQSLLDVTAAPVPPIGNVAASDRATMLTYIDNESVFTPDYTKVRTGVVNGRTVYTYPVTVKIAPYLRLMQYFAQYYGLKSFDNVTPTDYQGAKPVKLKISVDKLSHQMVRVETADNSFSETYSDYGIQRSIKVPTKTIPISDLQQKLKAISNKP